jgi:hypothetical protein
VTLQVSDKIYAYARKYFDNTVIVVFNKRNEPVRLTVNLPGWLDTEGMKAEFGSDFAIKDRELSIDLQPWSFEIINN